MNIVTIGVYGFDAESWLAALQAAGVDTLVDVRRRRGVRGAEYAFANSERLQQRLAAVGIRYLHRKDLSPGKEIRAEQAAADKAKGVARRKRTELAADFVAAYRTDVLTGFDPQALVADLPADAATIALLCVERVPAACHRSLLADYLQQHLGWRVTHVLPPDTAGVAEM